MRICQMHSPPALGSGCLSTRAVQSRRVQAEQEQKLDMCWAGIRESGLNFEPLATTRDLSSAPPKSRRTCIMSSASCSGVASASLEAGSVWAEDRLLPITAAALGGHSTSCLRPHDVVRGFTGLAEHSDVRHVPKHQIEMHLG